MTNTLSSAGVVVTEIPTLGAVDPELVPYLVWWTNRKHTAIEVPLRAFVPQQTLYSDAKCASKEGYGGYLDCLEVSGMWSVKEAGLHSNNLEHLAVVKFVKIFHDQIQNQSVLTCLDNSTTVYTIKQQSDLSSVGAWNFLKSIHCQVQVRHIPGKFNVLADSLSRKNQIIPSEWTLHPEILLPLWAMWGLPTIDLFATWKTTRLPRYVSPIPDPEAWRINALTFHWEQSLMYAFPPWSILGELLKKVLDVQAELILIAPNWPTQQWYPLLLDLNISTPIPLPVRYNLLYQPVSGYLNPCPDVLQLQAWRVSGKAYWTKGIRRM